MRVFKALLFLLVVCAAAFGQCSSLVVNPTTGGLDCAGPTYSQSTTNQTPGYTANTLLSGGGVVWTSGYTFSVSPAKYVIQGTQYSSPLTSITLASPDSTNDRIDTVAVNTSGAVVVLQGTPAASPIQPAVDPATQLSLTFVYVTAASSQPATISTTLLYDENAGASSEWNTSTSGSGWTVASTNNPYHGSKDVEATSVSSGYLQLQIGSGTVSAGSYSYLIFYVRSKASWGSKRSITLGLFSSGTQVGQGVTFGDNQFGFSSSVTTNYQQIVVPMNLFAATGFSFNQVRFTLAGSGTAIGFYLDYVQLQTSPAATQTSSTTPIACVGAPGNTAGSFGQSCYTSIGLNFTCNNTKGCTVAADWVSVAQFLSGSTDPGISLLLTDGTASQRGVNSSVPGITTTVANDFIISSIHQDGGCTASAVSPAVVDNGINSAGNESVWIGHMPSSATGTPGSITPNISGCGNNKMAFTVALERNPAVTPAVVQTRPSNGGYPQSLAFASNVTSGNVMYVSLFCNTTGVVSGSISDTLGSTWTQVGITNGGLAWVAPVTTTGADTISPLCSTSGGTASIAIGEYSGVLVPQVNPGNNNDVYLNTTTDVLWKKANSAWAATGKFVPQGTGFAGWSANVASTSWTGTLYAPLIGGGPTSTTEASVQFAAPYAGTFANLRITVSAAFGVGQTVAFTVRKNGSSQTSTCSISGGSATTCSDTSHSFTFAAGDTLNLMAVVTGTVAVSPNVMVSYQIQ